jgi:hypothetical protein
LRHLNLFQHECYLEVRLPRIKLPSGAVRLVELPWMGKLRPASVTAVSSRAGRFQAASKPVVINMIFPTERRA